MKDTLLILALLGLLTLAGMFMAGCGLLTGQVQSVNENGELEYYNSEGKVTTQAVDPVTGKQNEPVMEYAEDGGFATKGAAVAKSLLPTPWGDIAAGALTLAGTVLALWARKKNKEAREEREYAEAMEVESGAARELVKAIESEPTVKKVVKEKLAARASPELKALVKSAT